VLSSVINTLNPETYARAISDYTTETNYVISCGNTCAFISKEYFDDSFIDSPNDPVTIEGVTANKSSGIKPIDLSKIWGIDIETARRTLEATTQLKQQDSDSTLSRKFSTNDWMLRYKRIKSHFFTDTHFITSKARFTRGNKGMQLFFSEKGFVYVVPIKTEGGGSQVPSRYSAKRLVCRLI